MIYALFGIIFLADFLLPGSRFSPTRNFLLSPSLAIDIVALVVVITHVFEVNWRKLNSLAEAAGFYILPLLYLFSANYFFVSLPAPVNEIGTQLLFAVLSAGPTALTVAVLAKNKQFNLARYNFLFAVALITYFFSTYSISNFYWSNPNLLTQIFLVFGTFIVTWLIFYELFWVKRSAEVKSLGYVTMLAFCAAEVVWALSYWMTRYNFIFRPDGTGEPLIGIPLSSILLLISIGYFGWGVIFHRLTNTLTRKILYEYLGIAITFIIFILLTTRYIVG